MAAKRQRLAARRKAVGLTQEQLAERLGVECSTVVRWEGGETVPLPWIRPKLGRALHVSIEQLNELLTLEPAHQPGTVVSAVDEHGIHIEQLRQEQTPTTIPTNDMTTVAVGQAMAALLAEAYARLATAGALPFPDGLRAATTLSPLDNEDLHGGREPTGSRAIPAGQEQAERVTNALASLAFLGSTAARMPAKGDDQVRDQLAQFLCGWVKTMDRRELIQLLGWAAGTVAASPVTDGLDTDEQQRLVRAIVSPSLVDARVIDHIAAMLRHCQLQEDALGSRAVLPMALAQRNLIQGLLVECPTVLRPRMFSIYSDMSTSIGYYFFELNDINSSRRYYEQARAAAHNAGSVELGIYALCEWSYTESWQGQAPTGLDLAAAAQSLVSKAEDPLMRVGVAQRAATAYAFNGRYNECMVECERAQTSLAAAVGPASGESPGYFYNDRYLASHRSECLLRLGKPQEAAVSACAGLMLYDKSFVDGYAVCTLHLGNAHVQSGEIDEAARVVGDAAGFAGQTRSARLVKELRTTRARMQPWQDTHAVKELDDRLAAYGLRRPAAW
jgi:transcriptional regulator with XRE-family HTH domain